MSVPNLAGSVQRTDELRPEPRAKKRVMVVEDDPGLLALYRILLNGRGYRVIAAEDGEDAVASFDREGRDIDLVISDVGLPGGGVVAMLEEMKARGALPEVLICSGGVEHATELQLREVGANRFLQKPFRHADILGEIDRILHAPSVATS
jgi:DNA-binding response OmpR family regulator